MRSVSVAPGQTVNIIAPGEIVNDCLISTNYEAYWAYNAPGSLIPAAGTSTAEMPLSFNFSGNGYQCPAPTAQGMSVYAPTSNSTAAIVVVDVY